MITLGINAAFHDSSAALVVDGAAIAAAEEERFSRIKHAKRPLPFSAWELPFHAIDHCLKQAGIGLAGVDHVERRAEGAPGDPLLEVRDIGLRARQHPPVGEGRVDAVAGRSCDASSTRNAALRRH